MRVLIDLANTSVFRGVSRPNPPLIGSRLEDLLARVFGVIAHQGFSELRIRLYDGWFDESGSPTELYGILRAYLRGAFPTRTRTARVFVELAESVAAARHGERLIATARRQTGLGRYPVRLEKAPPSGCALPTDCELDSLRTWFKGNCPCRATCSVSTDTIAAFGYQKLVDTTIVSDIVWYASKNEQRIAVMSNDEDVIPGLLAARSLGGEILWLGSEDSPRGHYSTVLADHGVKYHQC